jgi:hypothetical protein
MPNVTAEQSPPDLRVVKAGYTPPLQHVPVEALDASWPAIAYGLRQLLRRWPVEWNETDIYRRLAADKFGLYKCDDGFVILERCEQPISLAPFLHVWVMYFKPGKGKARRTSIIQWLDGLTAQMKCRWWQFTSPRDGWFGADVGCEPVLTVWRRK